MLIDNRIRELIHREIDDELTPAEQAELQRCLDGSQEIRDLRASLFQADTAITDLPEVDPPSGLKSAIMEQLMPRPKRTPHWRVRIGEFYRSLREQMQIRPAIPFAVGTVAGIAIVMIFVGGSGSPFSEREHEYAATMAHPSQQAQPVLVHEFRLQGASGTIAVTQSDGISWVDIQSIATGSASIELSYDPNALILHVLNQKDLNEVSMKREAGIVRFDQAGEAALSLGFSVKDPEASTVSVAVASGDEQYVDSIVIGPATASSQDDLSQ